MAYIKVVIVGVALAASMQREVCKTDVDVLVVDRENHHVFQPPPLPSRKCRSLSRGYRSPHTPDLEETTNTSVVMAEVADVELRNSDSLSPMESLFPTITPPPRPRCAPLLFFTSRMGRTRSRTQDH